MQETLADDMALWTWRRWRPWVKPALVRGAAWGGAKALAVVAVIVPFIGVRPSSSDLAKLAITATLCLAAGLLGGAPTAPLEARARGRPRAARLGYAALCGAVAALGWVLLVAQVFYMIGVARGGMEHGLAELGRLVGGVLGGAKSPGLGITAGALLGVAAPFGLTVFRRLEGDRAGTQVVGGCTLTACGGCLLMLASLIVMLVLVGTAPEGFERALAAGGVAAFAAQTLVAAMVGAVIGAPVSVVTAPALALADRWAPLPPPAPDEPVDQPTG